jgi:hypothetical protein
LQADRQHLARGTAVQAILNATFFAVTLLGAGLMRNVKDYGAIGDGSAYDTDAVRTALTDAVDKGDCLYFPGGTYCLDEGLVSVMQAGQSLTIAGDGKGVSKLKWVNNHKGGIRCECGASGWGAEKLITFSIHGVSLITDTPGGGTAIDLYWPIEFANPQKKTRIHDVEIRGLDYGVENPKAAWNTGISVTNSGGLDISHTDILGLQQQPDVPIALAGLVCQSPSQSGPIRHFLSNIYVNYYETGCSWIGPHEGVYLTNFEIVGCGIGFRVMPSQNGNSGPVYHILNGHMDCRTSGIQFTGMAELKVQNVAFYHTNNGGIRTEGNIVQLEDTGHASIANCTFAGWLNLDNVPVQQNAISVDRCDGVIIYGNHFLAIKDTAVVCWQGTKNCHAVKNRYVYANPFVNLGDGTNSSDHNPAAADGFRT